jgi:hypothetical protein
VRTPADVPRLLLLACYYGRLTTHRPFANDLTALYARLAPLSAVPPGGVVVPGPAEAVPAEATAQVEAFCRRWPLPAGAERDIWWSFLVWRAGGGAVRLFPAPRWGWGPAPVSIDLSEPLAALANTAPRVPYDPVTDSPAELLARVDALLEPLRRQVLAAAEALRQAADAAGWREPPRRPADIGVRAERLFRRAVLRQSWDQIKRYTGARDRAMVRRQVLADAQTLGISLDTPGP